MEEPCTRYSVMQYLHVWCHVVHTICSKLQRLGCTLTKWEGPTELLLAKVKNASGRIGIFHFVFPFSKSVINVHHILLLSGSSLIWWNDYLHNLQSVDILDLNMYIQPSFIRTSIWPFSMFRYRIFKRNLRDLVVLDSSQDLLSKIWRRAGNSPSQIITGLDKKGWLYPKVTIGYSNVFVETCSLDLNFTLRHV